MPGKSGLHVLACASLLLAGCAGVKGNDYSVPHGDTAKLQFETTSGIGFANVCSPYGHTFVWRQVGELSDASVVSNLVDPDRPSKTLSTKISAGIPVLIAVGGSKPAADGVAGNVSKCSAVVQMTAEKKKSYRAQWAWTGGNCGLNVDDVTAGDASPVPVKTELAASGDCKTPVAP